MSKVKTTLPTGVIVSHKREGRISVESPYKEQDNSIIETEIKKEYSNHLDIRLKELFTGFNPQNN